MADKHTKRAKQYYENLIEERDDLFKNVEKLIRTANLQVQNISKSQVSLSEKETILTYLTRILVLFSELNTFVLKNLEAVDPPSITIQANEHFQEHTNSTKVQELQDYLKLDQTNLSQGISSFDFSKDGPKIPNDQVQNSSYVRKPLDDTTLKAICSTFINSNNTENAALCTSSDTPNALCSNVPPISAITPVSTTSEPLVQQQDNSVMTNGRSSPTTSNLSESDVFSAISSGTYHHPLTKFRPPTEIPKQYDTRDIEKVKENMRYISRKMGFDSEGFAQMSSQFDKRSAPIDDFQYERPERDVQNESHVIEKEAPEVTLTNNQGPNSNSSEEQIVMEKPEKLNNEAQVVAPRTSASLPDLQGLDGPSRSTGAIRKQKSPENLIEFSGSTSPDLEGCSKVTSWLTHTSQASTPKRRSSTSSNTLENRHVKKPNAIEKLNQVKRYDRNEEARERARADMPNLKLVPVQVPEVIKNDLNSEGSSPKKDSKPKVKDFNRNVVVYDIKQMEVPKVGDICVFSYIASPNEFYVQVVTDMNTAYLDEVSAKLDEKFSKTKSKFKSKQEASVRLGKFCYGYVWGETMTWYRLQILDWKLDAASDEVEVRSVDYGFKCTTQYIFLRELTADLAHIPMLAIKCHFPLLYPPGSTYSNRLTEWPQEAIDALCDLARDRAEPEDFTLFEIIFAMQDGDSVGVDLVHLYESDTDSLGRLLADVGLATEIVDEYNENPELGDFLEDIDELERADNLNEFVLGYDAKDEARICQFTRADGSCYKGKHCKLEHIQLKDGYTTDRTAVFYTALNDLNLPRKGETVKVLATAYVDSCTYLVQIIKNPVKKANTNMIMDKDMSDLMDAINHPKITAKFAPFKIKPALGEMVLAYHPIAKHWIRAAVRDVNVNGDESSIPVYSVDFGEEFFINIKNIRMMQEDFLHVPFQVIQIYLDNYQHNKQCDENKAKKFFNDHMCFKNFMAYIKSNSLPYKVRLTTFRGQDIGPTLVKAGLAEPRTIDNYVSEDTARIRNFDLE